MAKTSWGDGIPFHIDDGELDELTPQQIFVLGVEWGAMHARLVDAAESGLTTPIHAQIHRANEDRIKKLLAHFGRWVHVQEINDDWLAISG